MPLSLEEMLGQMVMVGFRGLTLDSTSAVAHNLKHRNLGGVLLFDYDVEKMSSERNIQSPAQVRALIETVIQTARTRPFVGIDYEGGMVNRLKPKFGFPSTLSALKMATLSHTELEAECGKMALTLNQAGFNLNFAPAVDLNTNPNSPAIGKYERSFSAQPDVVVEKAACFIRAHRAAKILTVVKHFPGHGSSANDSHLSFVDVSETWVEEELTPYRDLYRLGLVDSVMTAHVFHRRWDEIYPATLSPRVVPQMLRKEIGFDGVVFSDDMQMLAITRNYGLAAAVRLAFAADIDVLVFGNNITHDEKIVEKVLSIALSLVHSGEVSEARIERSYRRIEALKEKI